jgi:hypothetical protein
MRQTSWILEDARRYLAMACLPRGIQNTSISVRFVLSLSYESALKTET